MTAAPAALFLALVITLVVALFVAFRAGRKQERAEQLEKEKDKALHAESLRHRLVHDADYAARVREKFSR